MSRTVLTAVTFVALISVACIGRPWSEAKHPEHARDASSQPAYDAVQESEPNEHHAECTAYAETFYSALTLFNVHGLTRHFLPQELRERVGPLAEAAQAPERGIFAGAYDEQRKLCGELADTFGKLADAIAARDRRAYLEHRDQAEATMQRQIEVDRGVSEICGWPPPDDIEVRDARDMMMAKLARPSKFVEDPNHVPELLIAVGSGHLEGKAIQRVVREAFRNFRRCYETGLRRDPTLAGWLSVWFVIEPDGTVSKTAVAARDRLSPEDHAALDFLQRVNHSRSRWLTPTTTIPDDAVIECVLREYKKLKFPAPEGGALMAIYPVTFSPP